MLQYSTTLFALLIALIFSGQSVAQETESVIQKAMLDEVKRSHDNIFLEGVSRPFFISYRIRDVHSVSMRAQCGALTSVDTSHSRFFDVRVLVGDYAQTQENYVSMDFNFSQDYFDNELTIENDYDAIRRSLWLKTDQVYKQATEKLEKKRAALNQQQVSEEYKDLADFSDAEIVQYSAAPTHWQLDLEAWKSRIRSTAGIFNEYEDIHLSNITFTYKEIVYHFVNSEGTSIIEPRNITGFRATAVAQSTDGEYVDDFVEHHATNPEHLPSQEKLTEELHEMARNLLERTTAAKIEDSYTGPVLFVDQAVPELFNVLYLGEEGLVSKRQPVMEGPMAMMASASKSRNLGDRLGKRVLPKEISIASTPRVKEFDGLDLIGSYEVDAEGVKPSDEYVLVSEGKVKALLADRIPALHALKSTGHRTVSTKRISDGRIAAGVMDVQVSEGKKAAELKQVLLDRAVEEGLDYAYIIKRIRPESVPSPSMNDDPMAALAFAFSPGGASEKPLGEPLRIYRVNVADGAETIIRDAEFMKPGSGALRRLMASTDRTAWNMLLSPDIGIPGMGMFMSFGSSMSGSMGDVPLSIIAPNAIIIDDIEVRKPKRPYTAKTPVVASPLKGS